MRFGEYDKKDSAKTVYRMRRDEKQERYDAIIKHEKELADEIHAYEKDYGHLFTYKLPVTNSEWQTNIKTGNQIVMIHPHSIY